MCAEGVTAEIQQDTASGRVGPRTSCAFYGVLLALSISIWFLAIRAPLWLDETGSYWQISGGFSQIWPRQAMALAFPAYSYLLWCWSRLFGTGEAALRCLSISAMLAAAYIFYLCARELFDRELSAVALIVFLIDPLVAFEAVDIRPYAFTVLATNLAILILLRLRRSDSAGLAACLGLSSALIVYFHFLGAVALPALLLGLIVLKWETGRVLWRQLGIAAGVFAVAFLPLLPGIEHLFRTGKTHVFEPVPGLQSLAGALIRSGVALALAAAVLTAGITARGKTRAVPPRWQVLTCLSLAAIPILILFGVSIATPIRLFSPRHQLVAAPGVALSWALALSCYPSRLARWVFCLVLVGYGLWFASVTPALRQHGYTWKYALAAAEKSAAPDRSPVLICSDWPESDFVPMSPAIVKNTVYYAQLSYYPLSVPVVPLPRALNVEARDAGGAFIRQAKIRRQHFFALAGEPSYGTLEWLRQQAGTSFRVTEIGDFDGVRMLEFRPLGR